MHIYVYTSKHKISGHEPEVTCTLMICYLSLPEGEVFIRGFYHCDGSKEFSYGPVVGPVGL